MAQFDFYRNNSLESSSEFPYLLDIQSDILSELETRIVVPLSANVKSIKHLTPEFEIDKKMYVLITQELAGVHKSVLGEKCGSLQENRSEIISSIDFMVSGF